MPSAPEPVNVGFDMVRRYDPPIKTLLKGKALDDVHSPG